MNEYINLTLENIDEEHICCAIGDKKHQAGVDSKKEWIKSKLKDRSNIWREMKRLKEKAGVAESKIFPHNFRHLFARIYYKVTKDITGLADLLGHSSINVTRLYTATTETVFQKKLDKIVEQEILECTT